ncbi:hypothetical protein O0930_02835 [Clostridioides difficile]|nr:hypothetical protein [Clostridioides difficile]MCZ1128274.1 hypothetical protein [Clostridioides difficile]MDI6345896.1 hypothetical protein [Clostridioides difficile]
MSFRLTIWNVNVFTILTKPVILVGFRLTIWNVNDCGWSKCN